MGGSLAVECMLKERKLPVGQIALLPGGAWRKAMLTDSHERGAASASKRARPVRDVVLSSGSEDSVFVPSLGILLDGHSRPKGCSGALESSGLGRHSEIGESESDCSPW